MTNMRDSVIPKSDQLNFDDFIGGQSKTIRVTKVSATDGDQPRSVHYEGDNGKPWKPCKSMRRVLLHCWGDDGNLYAGRIITLYGDPEVKFGGEKVGGIRISHLSHIEKPIIVALTTTRAHRKPFTVHPLVDAVGAPSLDDALEDIANVPTMDGLEFKYKAAYKIFSTGAERDMLLAAKEKRKHELTTNQGDNNGNT